MKKGQENMHRAPAVAPGFHPGRLAVAVLLFLLAGAVGQAAALTDNFANRALVTDLSGQIDDSNTGATVEPNEPQHGGKPGGRSVWISWVAPADGVATFWTDGSTFDTLLSAYYFSQPADTTLDKLKETARNDDASPAAAPASLIQFGALAGQHYEIAVAGYRGASGDIRLRWDFVNATSPPPIIVSVPDDQAARQGDPVTLTVDMQTSPDLDLQWRFNGNSFGATGPTLFIPSLQPTNVGRYTLRIRIGEVRFETTPVELQINSDGQTNALARDKLLDAIESPLIGEDGSGGGGGGLRAAGLTAAAAGVVRGYNGSQIFNTTYATSDPDEPVPCGVASGASYWFAYQPPTNGTATLDTIGSTFDTVIAVYTYNPPLTAYSGLIPIACDNDAVAPLGAARLEFAAIKGRQYAVVIAGVGGARGIATLNYRLDVTRPPMPPTLVAPTSSRTAAAGADVTLQAAVTGSAPMQYSWRKTTTLIPGATNATLQLAHVAPEHSGDYILTVSNFVGAPLQVTLPLRVLIPPSMQFLQSGGALTLSFLMLPGQFYLIEQCDSLPGNWQPLGESVAGDGSMRVLTNGITGGARFYRVRVE